MLMSVYRIFCLKQIGILQSKIYTSLRHFTCIYVAHSFYKAKQQTNLFNLAFSLEWRNVKKSFYTIARQTSLILYVLKHIFVVFVSVHVVFTPHLEFGSSNNFDALL